MPIDRHAQRLLAMLAAAGQGSCGYGEVEERRRSFESLARLGERDPPALDRVWDVQAVGPQGIVPLRLYRPLPPGAGPGGGLVFFHGGGWVAGDLDTHDGLCRRLAEATACAIVAVDYRLAPEHPFPAGLTDCLAAASWVAENTLDLGIDPQRLGVAGDSAGGCLAAALCQMARDHHGPAIALQLLLCPILDVAARSASRRRLAEGYFLDEKTLVRDLELYGPQGFDLTDPRLSPLRGKNLAGLPPALIHTAEFDPFADEGEAYAARLCAAGSPASLTRHAGMIHFFYGLPAAIPYALTAIEMIGAQVRESLSGKGLSEPDAARAQIEEN